MSFIKFDEDEEPNVESVDNRGMSMMDLAINMGFER